MSSARIKKLREFYRERFSHDQSRSWDGIQCTWFYFLGYARAAVLCLGHALRSAR